MFRVGYEAEHRLALAEHLSELTPLERANLLSDTWATTLAGHNGSRSSSSWRRSWGWSPTRRPGPRCGRALVLANRIALPEHEDALHEAVTRSVGPTYRNLGFDAASDEGDRTPSLRSLAINLMGTVGADPGVRDEAARAFRRVADRRRPGAADPRRRRVGHPGRRRPAGAARRLRRAPGALPHRQRRRRRRCAPSARCPLPRRGAVPAHVRPGLTEVRTQNGLVVISALLANPVAGRPSGSASPRPGTPSSSGSQECAAAHRRVRCRPCARDADFARRRIEFLADHPLASGPRRVAQSVERLNVNVAFAARASGPGRPTALRAAGRRDHAGLTQAAPASNARESDSRAGPAGRRHAGTRGFMPDDEGEALLHAALPRRPGRAAGAAPRDVRGDRRLVRQVLALPRGGGRGHRRRAVPSTTTGAPRRTSPGGSTTRPIWSIPRGRIDTLLHWRRAIGRRRARDVRRRRRGRLPHRRGRWTPPAGLLLHRRRPRRGAGVGRLPGLGATGGARRMAGHPRRLPGPGRRRPTALRAVPRRARLGRVRRGRRVRQPARPASRRAPPAT